jgi:agmatinase
MSKQSKIEAFDPNGVGLRNGHFIGLPFEEAEAELVLLPVPWDATVSYADGTASGPENILQASAQLDLYDADLADAWQMGIYFRPSDAAWAKRGEAVRHVAKAYIEALENGQADTAAMRQSLEKVNAESAALADWVQQQTTQLMDAGKLVGLVGGEHSVPLGYLRALSQRHESFGILQIDAHCDLRPAYEGFEQSHASIFYNTLKIQNIDKLVQVGIRDFCEAEARYIAGSAGRVVAFLDAKMRERQFAGESYEAICKSIVAQLPEKVYVSFDIDGLQPDLCPHTGTPVAGGLSFQEALFLLKTLAQSGRTIIGFDLCEVGGLGHEWDGNVGARLLYKLCNWMGHTNGRLRP